MQARLARPLVAVLAVAAIAVAIAAHYAIAVGHVPALGATLALVPVAAIAFVALRRRNRPNRPLLPILALVAFAALLWAGWDALERHFRNIYFLEHVGTNLLLGAMFGRTLAGETEPLCARFARLLHGPLPPEVKRYTRQVTLAWTVFFLALAALSTALYLGGNIAAWSILANFLTLPLVGAMFAVEYTVRLRALPGWRRESILYGMNAFWRHSGTSPSEASR